MPIILERPCGLALIVWPWGEVDVLTVKQARDLVDHIALCEMARAAREYC